MKQFANVGKSLTGWFYGMKLHLVINGDGEILSFCLTSGNVSDINEDVIEKLTKNIFGKLVGKKIHRSKLVYSFHRNIEKSANTLVIKPPKFSRALKINLSVGNHSLDITMNRIPNDSSCVIKFSSEETSPIKVFCTADTSSNSSPHTIEMNFSLNSIESVDTKITAFNIYNAIMHGKALLCGTMLKGKFSGNIKEVPSERIVLWEDIRKLEEILKVKFNASLPISNSESEIISILYSNLIEGKPVKKLLDKITLTGESNNARYNDIAENTQYYFEYNSTDKITILGTEITCYSITSIFDGTVAKIELSNKNTSKFAIYLEKREKNMYSTTLYFTSREDLTKFQEQPNYIDKIYKESISMKESVGKYIRESSI
jgi:hypothetical protein